MNSKLIAIAAVATIVPVAVGGALLATSGAANASAHVSPASHAAITAQASTPTPASGKVFTVSGDFTENGAAASGHVVEIQSLTDGHYQTLTGARMKTASNGDYTMRVVLDAKGVRDLRVVGLGQNTQPNAHQDFSVKVR